MGKLVQFKEWQSASGKWHTAYTDSFSPDLDNWILGWRILDLTPADYFIMLKEKYNATIVHTEKLTYAVWDKNNYSKMHEFTLLVNRIARKKNFCV